MSATSHIYLPPDRCPECSSIRAVGTCTDLFFNLLALDQSRRSPWSEYHGVSVATYLLQHPSQSAPAMLPLQWRLANMFAAEGLAAVHAFTTKLVAQNRGEKHRLLELPPVEVDFCRVPAGFAVTIADVSVDGSFPAAGFRARIAAWVQATIEAWTRAAQPPQTDRQSVRRPNAPG